MSEELIVFRGVGKTFRVEGRSVEAVRELQIRRRRLLQRLPCPPLRHCPLLPRLKRHRPPRNNPFSQAAQGPRPRIPHLYVSVRHAPDRDLPHNS